MALHSTAQLVAAIGGLSRWDLRELVDEIERRFDVSAGPRKPLAAPEYDSRYYRFTPGYHGVTLIDYGSRKVDVIKLVRSYRGISLVEAKRLVEEGLPLTILENHAEEDEVLKLKRQLDALGAVSTLIQGGYVFDPAPEGCAYD